MDNVSAARRDEFVRQQREKRDRQRMAQKVEAYDSIMRGDSNTVSNQYLVNFEAKGIDVVEEDHEITLLNARNKRKRHRKRSEDIDDTLYRDMDSTEHEQSSKSTRTLEDVMERRKAERKRMIDDARARQQHFMQQIECGNIDGLLAEMSGLRQEYASKLRAQSVFSKKTNPNRSQSFVQRKIAMNVRERKRKLNEMQNSGKMNDEDHDVDVESPKKKQRTLRRERDNNGYAAIPPPAHLYGGREAKTLRKEAARLIDGAMKDQHSGPTSTHSRSEMNVESQNDYISAPRPPPPPPQSVPGTQGPMMGTHQGLVHGQQAQNAQYAPHHAFGSMQSAPVGPPGQPPFPFHSSYFNPYFQAFHPQPVPPYPNSMPWSWPGHIQTAPQTADMATSGASVDNAGDHPGIHRRTAEDQ